MGRKRSLLNIQHSKYTHRWAMRSSRPSLTYAWWYEWVRILRIEIFCVRKTFTQAESRKMWVNTKTQSNIIKTAYRTVIFLRVWARVPNFSFMFFVQFSFNSLALMCSEFLHSVVTGTKVVQSFASRGNLIIHRKCGSIHSRVNFIITNGRLVSLAKRKKKQYQWV